ncbi:MAG: NAD-dependent epimerase/dehydratase family protein [Gammaproteobacteria bacterium]|jgi:uncharacterized protein YbjT (DUF2867 family)|nr:NAD-dependent epimerase/dehydratase family protein [Gammaproteobacteria bacterium]
MNILITGASGFIGQHIAKRLLSAGHSIVSIDRRHGHDFNQLTAKKAWLPLLINVDVVINCVGIITETRQQSFSVLHHRAPAALFHACVEAGIKRVIQISALGADEQAISHYHLSKKAADDVLRSLNLGWFVLRPSLVYGSGGKSMAMFKRLARLPVLPLMDGGNQIIQPIHINDLTETVLKCLTSDQSKLTLDLVGAYSLSFIDWLQLMRNAENKSPARVIPIPFSLVLGLSRFTQHILPIANPDNLRMLRKGNFADAKPLADFLGHAPMDIKTGWSQF